MTFSTRKVKRLAAAVLILLFICFAGFGRAQSGYSLDVKDTPLGAALKLIQKKTGYNFVYFQEDVQKYHASFDVRNASIDQIMSACLKDKPLSYSIDDKIVSIRMNEPIAAPGETMIDIRGQVFDEKGQPMAGANVVVKGRDKATITDDKGNFHLEGVASNATLFVTYIGYAGEEVKLNGKVKVEVKMKRSVVDIDAVNISLSNGYESISPERATGSYAFVDNNLLNREVSTDLVSRIANVTSGLYVSNQNSVAGVAFPPGLVVRGPSTINSNTQPLIVVDNFPYDGDLFNINPNDVENVTVLKDAGAASIWGTRAGNGVIVITTKKGLYNRAPKLSLNTNFTIQEKPNLYYAPTISSSDYIDLETYLYQQGFYGSRIGSYNQAPLDPVQTILLNQTNGIITAAQATDQINALRNDDIRQQAAKYLYQANKNQQYSLSLSGGGPNDQYFISGGLDNNDGNNTFLKRNDYRRLSVDFNNTYAMMNHRLELSVGLNYYNSFVHNNGMSGPAMPYPYPYAQLVNPDGSAASIAQYNQGYIDTAGQGMLLDWNYRPLNELNNSDNTITELDYRVNVGLKYRLPFHINVDVKYQYGNQGTTNHNYQNIQSFFTRNLINSYSQIDWSSGTISYPVPIGGILDQTNTSFLYQNFRAQLSYSNKWNHAGQINFIGGTEVRDAGTTYYQTRYFGYDPTHETTVPVDLVDQFPNYITGGISSIPSNQGISSLDNRYLSYFGNVSYTYLDRYTVSTSGRRDGSNLFGVETNQKYVPLWSAGGSWEVSKEKFYHINWIPYARLRTTYGYQGNVNNNLSALLTTVYLTNNRWEAPMASVANPPNPNLRWERVGQLNMAADLAMVNDRIHFTLEYYLKNATNLIAASPLAPSLGMATFTGNVASMKGRGVDITLNTQNTTGRVIWSSTLIFSYTKDWVTKYTAPISANSNYVGGSLLAPAVGKPVSAIYSYRWAGLDSVGNPRGVLNGKVSEDYAGIEAVNDVSQMRYEGPASPQYFGSFRNAVSYKQFSISSNIVYAFGYVFQRPSLNYYNLYNSGYIAGIDYAKRWQRPGDEKKTNVPSMIYPLDAPDRDNFYQYSEVLTDRGDHIRLQDIQLSYDMSRRTIKGLPFQAIRLYLYLSNLGLIWKANHDGIDPDFVPSGNYGTYPNPKSFSVGAKIDI